jgi:hypothetical protein
VRDNIRVVSDPTIGSQSGRQNLGIPGFSKLAAGKAAEPEQAESAGAFAPAPPAGEDGNPSKQRLTSFLSKLETTWQLFNKDTREED